MIKFEVVDGLVQVSRNGKVLKTLEEDKMDFSLEVKECGNFTLDEEFFFCLKEVK